MMAVAVVGAGAMGTGIARVVAQSRASGSLYDAAEAAAKGIATIDFCLARLRESAVSPDDKRLSIVGRLRVADHIDNLTPVGLVIEAVVETLEWTDLVGPGKHPRALDALRAAHGDDRYGASHLVRQHVDAGLPLCVLKRTWSYPPPEGPSLARDNFGLRGT